MLTPERVTPPAELPVSVEDAMANLRIDDAQEHGRVRSLIAAATGLLDGWDGKAGRALVTQEWRARFPGFSDRMRLPVPPVQEITGITYYDRDGEQQTIADLSGYRILKDVQGHYIARPRGVSWPATAAMEDAVAINFTSGSEPDDVPEEIKQAIHLLVGHWYANREAVNIGNITSEIPLAFEAILNKLRVYA